MVTAQGLFREEIIRAKRGDWLGTIIIAAPLSRWLLALLASVIVGALILILFFGHYTRRESVSGQLVPVAGLITLNASGAGLVTESWVHDGQAVREGDRLIEISGLQDSAALGNTAAVVARALSDQRARLQSDLNAQSEIAQLQAKVLSDKEASLNAQIAQLESQVKIEQEQKSGQEELLERIQPLAPKGYVSPYQIQQQKSAVLTADAQIKMLTRQSLDLRQQRDAAHQQLVQLPLDSATHRNEIERQLASLDQAEAKNEMQRAIILRAPHNGLISTVLSKPGQTVASGQSLVSILPTGSLLQAELLVPSRAIGFIEHGSRVVLRYQAFPYQKFGLQYGYVADISRSALSPSEVAALVGQQSQVNESLYRVQVALDRQSVLAYGKAEPLKPGMVVDADILMERRRLMEWVFEPLYGLGHRLSGDGSRG